MAPSKGTPTINIKLLLEIKLTVLFILVAVLLKESLFKRRGGKQNFAEGFKSLKHKVGKMRKKGMII